MVVLIAYRQIQHFTQNLFINIYFFKQKPQPSSNLNQTAFLAWTQPQDSEAELRSAVCYLLKTSFQLVNVELHKFKKHVAYNHSINQYNYVHHKNVFDCSLVV